MKNAPGRKTGVNDAAWLADLLAHGRVRGSFAPDAQTQEQRGLLRTRKQPVRDRISRVQRPRKTLEDANIKLDSVISDVTGLSGRAMIGALIAGESNPGKPAERAHRRIKASPGDLRQVICARRCAAEQPSIAFLLQLRPLQLHLQQIDALDPAVAAIDQEAGANVEPFRTAIELLTTIPGISDLSARVIAAEIGIDMCRFSTGGHLIL
ncbi:MAG: IS110 family transposase, partial [Methylocella sp.]